MAVAGLFIDFDAIKSIVNCVEYFPLQESRKPAIF